jgi:beta-N-acetylhexosaminidase
MAPVSTAINRREAIIRAIAAGNDIVMIKNVDNFDPELPQAIAKWVSEAIEQRILHEQTIVAAAARVRALKRELSDSRMRL